MADLLIKEQEFKQLDQYIGTLPTRYGLPLVDIFRNIQQARAVEAQTAAQNAKQAALIGEPITAGDETSE